MPTKKPDHMAEFTPTHDRCEDLGERHVWRDRVSAKFVYEDETNCFNGCYDTFEQARQGLRDYCKFSLDGGIREVEEMLEKDKALHVLSSVNLARKAIAECRGEQAIMILRADADKIRGFNLPLYTLVMNKPTEVEQQ